MLKSKDRSILERGATTALDTLVDLCSDGVCYICTPEVIRQAIKEILEWKPDNKNLKIDNARETAVKTLLEMMYDSESGYSLKEKAATGIILFALQYDDVAKMIDRIDPKAITYAVELLEELAKSEGDDSARVRYNAALSLKCLYESYEELLKQEKLMEQCKKWGVEETDVNVIISPTAI